MVMVKLLLMQLRVGSDMKQEDYKAFVVLKDLLYSISQDGLVDDDTKRMRDEMIARLYAIRHPKVIVDAMKSVGYELNREEGR
jgi:hypothetical protein